MCKQRHHARRFILPSSLTGVASTMRSMHERALQVRAVAAALHAALERLGQWRGMAVTAW